ncbi:histamine N-methyltransferase A isoform X1 [Opisthocomus hoazin]
MRSLTAEEYVEAFKSFLDHSTEHQCMDEFNKEEMPNIMASLGNGKSTINVLGIGSGTGEQDLKMIRILQAAHPGVLIDNEIVEPNPQHVAAYKELVNQAPDLQNVSFIWHQLTSSEYKQQVKEKGTHKKFDFIHMIQMLYRVEDIPSTIKFFHSCLDHHGKLLIIILSGKNENQNTPRARLAFQTPKNHLPASLCRNLEQCRFPCIFPSSGVFQPSLEFPEQIDAFPGCYGLDGTCFTADSSTPWCPEVVSEVKGIPRAPCLGRQVKEAFCISSPGAPSETPTCTSSPGSRRRCSEAAQSTLDLPSPAASVCCQGHPSDHEAAWPPSALSYLSVFIL